MIELHDLPKRVLTGSEYQQLNQVLKAKKSALPAVCVSSTGTANAALAAAAAADAPIIILTSFGGGHFNAGKTLPAEAAIWAAGAQSIAQHVHIMAEHYGVTVVLSTDHCQMERLEWIDEMLKINEAHLEQTGQTLWSGHMIDLSHNPLKESLPVYKEYLQRHHNLGLMLEIELGETGGEEDGVTGHAEYTTPDECAYVYQELSEISDLMTWALTFGNVHGVYKGDFKLEPDILRQCQERITKDFLPMVSNPLDLVFHGGSGCTPEQMSAALEYGIIKQNIDTDTQWAYTKPIVEHVRLNGARLNTQVGYSEDPDAPNKKFYDPRGYLTKAEASMTARILESFQWLNSFELCKNARDQAAMGHA